MCPGLAIGLSCPRIAGLVCSTTPCPGSIDPSACRHLENLTAWRLVSADDQFAKLSRGQPPLDPRVRDAVNACPYRGSVLPISSQDDCGCQGREVTECRAGQGKIPGRVTLRECLECRRVLISVS